MTGRELSLYLRARLTHGLGRLLNRRAAAPMDVTPLDDVLQDSVSPLALSRPLVGRANAEREAAVARYLAERGIPFSRHRFASFEGNGENFSVDVGSGDRLLLLSPITTPCRAAREPMTMPPPWASCCRFSTASSRSSRPAGASASFSPLARSSAIWARGPTCGRFRSAASPAS